LPSAGTETKEKTQGGYGAMLVRKLKELDNPPKEATRKPHHHVQKTYLPLRHNRVQARMRKTT